MSHHASKCKPTLNAKAICITDDTVLEGLKRKKVEKAAAEKKKKRGKETCIGRECNKKIREEKRLERERKKRLVVEQKKSKCDGRKTRSRKNCTQEGAIDDVLAVLRDSVIEFN